MKRLYGLASATLGTALLASCGHGSFGSSVVPAVVGFPEPNASNAYAADAKITPDFRDLGRVPDTLTVRLSVMLRYRHQDELDSLVAAQSDRRSPSFRRYLTNEEFDARFAPSEAAYRRVIQFFAAHGLKVVQAFHNRTILEVEGAAASVQRLFATRIDYGMQAGQGSRYKNVTEALMPHALRDVVVAIVGFDNLVSFRPRLDVVRDAAVKSEVQKTHLRGPNGALGPLGFSRAYDEPNQHGYDGKGRAIANTFPGDINDGDLKVFLNYFGVKPAHALRRIKVDGGRLGTGELETTLDGSAQEGLVARD